MSRQVPSIACLGGATQLESSSSRPRILLADDHDLVLEHVQAVLEDYEIIGTAHNGEDLVTEALRLHPDVIVLDITMPLLNGIDAAHELREAGSTSRFVFLTVHDEPAFLHACFADGALGYVYKSHLGTDLVPAINEALSGHRYVSPSIPH
jgi:DNA-binding NarL/FixJ family response regulator